MTARPELQPARRLPAAARRAQVLDVALELFAAHGYHGTSMDDVAAAAGVTKPVVYQHVSSKRALYQELVERERARLLELLAAAAADLGDPQEQVRAGFGAFFRFVSDRTGAFQLLFGHRPRAADGGATTLGATEDAVAALIGDFVGGTLEPAHRALVGRAIAGMVEVAGRSWAGATRGPLDPAEGEILAARLADLAWAGLRGLPPGPERGGRRRRGGRRHRS